MSGPVISQISICNSALYKVGADRISSIDQDTRSAIICKALYNQLRDEVLRMHPWHFAKKRAVLAPESTAPLFEYDFRFLLPNDCLRVLRTECDSSPFELENGAILSSDTELSIIYIYRNTDESSWDSQFAETFAWRLAMELAFPLTQSSARYEELMKGYKDALAQARSTNGMEGTVRSLEADLWTNSRRSSGRSNYWWW